MFMWAVIESTNSFTLSVHVCVRERGVRGETREREREGGGEKQEGGKRDVCMRRSVVTLGDNPARPTLEPWTHGAHGGSVHGATWSLFR